MDFLLDEPWTKKLLVVILDLIYFFCNSIYLANYAKFSEYFDARLDLLVVWSMVPTVPMEDYLDLIGLVYLVGAFVTILLITFFSILSVDATFYGILRFLIAEFCLEC